MTKCLWIPHQRRARLKLKKRCWPSVLASIKFHQYVCSWNSHLVHWLTTRHPQTIYNPRASYSFLVVLENNLQYVMSLMLPSTSAGLKTMLVSSTTDTWTHRTVSPSQQCVLIGHCCTHYPALVETLKHQCHLKWNQGQNGAKTTTDQNSKTVLCPTEPIVSHRTSGTSTFAHAETRIAHSHTHHMTPALHSLS